MTPLPTSADGRPRRACRRGTRRPEARAARGAVRDRQEGAHAEPLELGLAEHPRADRAVLAREALGDGAEVARRADVRRQVREVAGQGCAGGDGGAVFEAALGGGEFGAVGAGDAHLLQARRRRPARGLEVGDLVAAAADRLGDEARPVVRIDVGDALGRDQHERIARARAQQRLGRGGERAPVGAAVPVLGGAEADQEDARRRAAAEVRQQQRLAEPPREVALIDDAREAPAECAVEVSRDRRQRATVVDADDGAFRARPARSAGLCCELHFCSPLRAGCDRSGRGGGPTLLRTLLSV